MTDARVAESFALRGASDEIDPIEQARAAVHVGLWASAVRCVLTYVIAPALGALGFFLGPVGLLLQVLGAATSTAGAVRLWPTGHRLRVPYAVVALLITTLTVGELLRPLLPAGGAR